MTSYWIVERPSRQWAAVRTQLGAMMDPPQKWEMLTRKFLNDTWEYVIRRSSHW